MSLANYVQTRDRCRLVPFTSRFRLLAFLRRYQHATVLRTAHTTRRRRRHRPHPVRQGQSRDRCLQIDQPTDSHAWSGASTNDV